MPSVTPLMSGDRPRRGARIPDSCIEAAEYIIKVHETGRAPDWRPGTNETFGRDVWLHFANASFNLTTDDLVALVPQYGIKSFDFTQHHTLGVGEGIAFLRPKMSARSGYNMHFQAILSDGGDYTLSNAMEAEADVGLARLADNVETVRYDGKRTWFDLCDDFSRAQRATYAVGLLTTDPDAAYDRRAPRRRR